MSKIRKKENVMKYKIHGELAQVAELIFSKNETCWGSRGSIMTMSSKIEWSLKVPGGVEGAIRRSLSGENISLTFIEAKADDQRIMLASNQPGKLMGWDLSQGAIMTTRGSFVAAFGPQVNIDISIAKRAGAAIFGGAGLFLQKISGQGIALIHGAGDFVDRQLENGDSILVSTGNLAAFADSVDYNIETVSGCRRIFFGGEGLFMTKLTGPGRVLLQTLKRVTSTTT
ncbi:MAG: TIGR00266 family protein [Anaerolineaceae bacterium 4572_78]|nr:MAG: TIGR00266 family protein [Anaerolineaceae bacterium 4572_78]